MLKDFIINENWKVTGIYPVGSLYLSLNSTNPSNYFGGTWERFGNGKVLIGVNPNDSDFLSAELTGGEKEIQLTLDELPRHQHLISYKAKTVTAASSSTKYESPLSSTGATTGSGGFLSNYVGNSQPHNNLMPYATCYIWKRIA